MRMTIYKLHSFLGLHLFVVFSVFFFTGSVLLFIWEIETGINSDIRLKSPINAHDATIGQIYDKITEFDDTLQPISLEHSDTGWVPDRTIAKTGAGERVNVWSHPTTGEILGVSGKSAVRGIIIDLHVDFLTGHRIGAILASGFSIVLTAFLVTGLVTYRRFWRGLFRAPPKNSGARAWWGGVHRLLAIWLLPFLAVMAVTGTYYFCVRAGLISTSFPSPGQVSARVDRLPVGFDGSAIERSITIARTAIPDLEVTVVNMPKNSGQGLSVFGYSEELFPNKGANRVIVDPATFDIVSVQKAIDLTALQRWGQLNASFHTGIWGGIYSRILWFIFGLAATALTFTGAMVYSSRVSNMPDSRGETVIGRIWYGMGALKWALVIYGLVLFGLAIWRYGL